MASRFLHPLSEERLDPEAVTNRISLSASDNDLVQRRPHASRARNHVAWVGLQQSMSVQGQFQTSARANAMSAFPSLATRQRTSLEVCFVPRGDIRVAIGSARRTRL